MDFQTPLRTIHQDLPPPCGKGKFNSIQTRNPTIPLTNDGAPSNHPFERDLDTSSLLSIPSRCNTNTLACLWSNYPSPPTHIPPHHESTSLRRPRSQLERNHLRTESNLHRLGLRLIEHYPFAAIIILRLFTHDIVERTLPLFTNNSSASHRVYYAITLFMMHSSQFFR